jgi:histidine triad (HIT) family protein
MTRPCLFCSIIKYKMPAIIIYEDKDFVALMDKYPISPGHSLVIPRSHHESLLSMTPSEVGNLYSAVSTISRAANQIIPHVHVHIIPRYEDDSREGRWPSRKIGNIEQLTSTAQKIKSVLHVYSDIGLSDT